MGRTIIYFNAKLCQPDHPTRGPESDHSGQNQYPINKNGPRGDPTRDTSHKKQALKANTALNSNSLKVWG